MRHAAHPQRTAGGADDTRKEVVQRCRLPSFLLHSLLLNLKKEKRGRKSPLSTNRGKAAGHSLLCNRNESIFTKYDLIPSSNCCRNDPFHALELNFRHLLQMWSWLRVIHANRNYLSSTSSRQQFVHRICPHRRQCRRTFSSENRRPHCIHFSTVLFGTKKLRWYRFSLGRIRYASQLPP